MWSFSLKLILLNDPLLVGYFGTSFTQSFGTTWLTIHHINICSATITTVSCAFMKCRIPCDYRSCGLSLLCIASEQKSKCWLSCVVIMRELSCHSLYLHTLLAVWWCIELKQYQIVNKKYCHIFSKYFKKWGSMWILILPGGYHALNNLRFVFWFTKTMIREEISWFYLTPRQLSRMKNYRYIFECWSF